MRVLMMVAATLAVTSALSPLVMMDSRGSDVPAEWTRVGPADADTVIGLTFAVTERADTVARLHDMLMAVADPKSPTYGQHYNMADLRELLADEANIATVRQYLQSFDVVDMKSSINEEFISVKVTVAVAERMLHTTFSKYAHATRDVTVHRADYYMLPSHVASAVDFVGHVMSLPTLNAPAMIAGMSTGLRGGASGDATPSVISSFYGISQNDVKNPKSTNAVFETIQQYFDPSDITAFDKEYNVPPQTIAKVIGPNTPSACASNPNNCVEASLDVQVITSIAQEGSTTFWSIPGDESFLQWIEAVANDSNPPLVHSISYGAPEGETPAGQDENFDKEVMKMGLRGLTVLVAAGDDGVAGSSARSNKAECGFNPSYPASAPHVTAVGATQGPESGSPEIVCQSNKDGTITSGGGFSNVYPTQSWQSSAVSNYLSTGPNLPPTSAFNTSGRGYPDITAMGHNYPIVVAGQTYVGSGTSASTPLVAAMVTLVNSARLTAGKSSLGFMNPALYGFDASVYNDITSGENNCCAGHGSPICCQYGFTAGQGWDPASGLGSPKFDKFMAAAMALP